MTHRISTPWGRVQAVVELGSDGFWYAMAFDVDPGTWTLGAGGASEAEALDALAARCQGASGAAAS